MTLVRGTDRRTRKPPIHFVLREFILTKVASSNITLPALDDVRAAAARIRGSVHRTPLLASRSISERIGVEVRLKCENLQRAGSFKIRGATNALLQLTPEQRKRGVVAFSSGNHAQGVALAAQTLGIPATIVMPENSVQMKVEATRAYGATVVTAGVTAATRIMTRRASVRTVETSTATARIAKLTRSSKRRRELLAAFLFAVAGWRRHCRVASAGQAPV